MKTANIFGWKPWWLDEDGNYKFNFNRADDKRGKSDDHRTDDSPNAVKSKDRVDDKKDDHKSKDDDKKDDHKSKDDDKKDDHKSKDDDKKDDHAQNDDGHTDNVNPLDDNVDEAPAPIVVADPIVDPVVVTADPAPTPIVFAPPDPIVLFTAGDDNIDFFAISNGEPLNVANTNDDMHNAQAGNDTVVLPTDQATANLVGYDTAIAFNGGDGDDVITGGATDDIILTGRHVSATSTYANNSAGSGTDVVYGMGGNDTIYGDLGHDTLHGGDGNDTIYANGNPWITTAGDSIFGDAGNDILRGSYGNDIIDGGTGNDYIEGQNGNDVLTGGAGADRIFGGSGNDVFIYRAGDSDTLNHDQFYGDKGIDTLRFEFDTTTDLLSSINAVNAAADYVATADTLNMWFNTSDGLSIVGIEAIETYVAGAEVDYTVYATDVAVDVIPVVDVPIIV